MPYKYLTESPQLLINKGIIGHTTHLIMSSFLPEETIKLLIWIYNTAKCQRQTADDKLPRKISSQQQTNPRYFLQMTCHSTIVQKNEKLAMFITYRREVTKPTFHSETSQLSPLICS